MRLGSTIEIYIYLTDFQDFIDKDFEIKQINDNILSAKLKINRVDTEIKEMKRLKKKYKKEKIEIKKYKKEKRKQITIEYFLELYPDMDKDDFEATFKNDAKKSIIGMFNLLNGKLEDKINFFEKNIEMKYMNLNKLYRRT